MTAELTDKKIAFLVANEGIEQVELTEPWKAVEAAGGQPFLVAPDSGTAQAFNHLEAADSFEVDRPTGEKRPEEHTSELKSLMSISYAGFCLTKKRHNAQTIITQ